MHSLYSLLLAIRTVYQMPRPRLVRVPSAVRCGVDSDRFKAGGGAATLPAAAAADGAAEAPPPPASFMAAYAELYPHAPAPVPSSLRSRTVRTCYEVGRALSDVKWGDAKWGEPAGRVDCLFALERLAAPYRNIRGHDIGVHTEPIDALWPMATPPPGSAAGAPHRG